MPRIFITGGSRRLGRAFVLKFADLGWNVCFSYNSSINAADQLIEILSEYKINTYSFKADLTDYSDLSKNFFGMISNFGLPDVIVNNAGVFPESENINELGIEAWDLVMKTNLYAPFYISKLYSEAQPPDGKIINIGSIGGMQVWNGRIPYHISKNGIIHLTKVLSQELAPNITVNCVNPGTIKFDNEPDEHHVPSIPVAKIPMNKYVTPDDIFKAVYFFANSPNTITGQSISVDGGYSISK